MTVPSFIDTDKNDQQRIDAVRKGLEFESFLNLRDALDISTDDLAGLLGIPRRTLSKRQKEGAFKLSESNSLSRISRVYQETVSFFGNKEDSLQWLKTPLPALGSTPLNLLDTDPGADAVSVLLRQLAWGIYP